MPFDATQEALEPPQASARVNEPLSRAARLRRLAAIAAEADPELAEALATMAVASVTLDQAMNWPAGWQQHEQRRQRDEAIRTAAAAMEGSVNARARSLATQLRRGTSPAAKAILAANAGRPLAYRSIIDLIR
jgi:hypothetical protein